MERVIDVTRVGIITFLHNDNYGSLLQAWALQQAVRSLGLEAEHIDYRPCTAEKIRNMARCGNSPALLTEGLRKRAVKARQADAQAKSAALAAFRREHMRLSPPCRDHAALAKAAASYDILLAGSDQIWSPVWLNPAYFLDFALPGQRRMAYAPSLGVSALPRGRKARMIRELVAPFDRLSVREAEGAAILQSLTGRAAEVLPDPVALPEPSAWQALAERPKRAKPYLLCYFIGDSPDYWARVASLAQESGLEAMIIPVTAQAWRQPYEMAGGLSPQAWVGHIAGAARVVTDSFHGAAFAYMLGTPVTVLRRYREDDPASKNSRIDQLHRSLGIEAGREADPAWVQARFAQLRTQGMAYLWASFAGSDEPSSRASASGRGDVSASTSPVNGWRR